MKTSHFLITALFLLVVISSGCDFSTGGNFSEVRDPQTRFIDVLIDPDPVAMGDTATFTAVIEDSLDTSFEFRWFLEAPSQTTEENQIEWIANVEPGRYVFVVQANNGDTHARLVNREFSVNVVDSSTTATQR